MTSVAETNERRGLWQTDFPAEEFIARRDRVFDAIGSAHAVIFGAAEAGAFGTFRQHNDFHYLCGIETPGACLLMDGTTSTVTLYLPPRDERLERVDGPTLAAEDAAWLAEACGVDRVRDLAALEDDLRSARTLHTPHAPMESAMACRDTLEAAQRQIDADPWNGRPPAQQHRLARLREKLGDVELRDLSPILDGLRRIKSPREIECMRRAGRLCALGLTEAMRCTQRGVFEYELAAVAEAVYRLNGARGAAYRPIVASGSNIWHSHYWRNERRVEDGDWVLFDCAPDLRYYTSDIGRFWPVSGRYDATQRKLYGFIVAYHKVLLDLIEPGKTTDRIHDEAARAMQPVVDAMSFADEAEERGVRATLSFHKHLTHGVGMAVHDHGYWGESPLEPGAVIALDPQLWIPEKKIYVRVEDTIVVTDAGVENFTADAPLELDETERAVGTGGLLQNVPPALRLNRSH